MTTETNITTPSTEMDSLLEGFRLYNAPAPKKTTPVVTIRTRTINFNKAAMIAMGYSPYYSILFSNEKKQIVVLATDSGHPFYKKRDDKQDMARWASFQITHNFMDFARLNREELLKEGIKCIFRTEMVHPQLSVYPLFLNPLFLHLVIGDF